DVVGHLEVAERAATLGVRLALRDALPVELRHLLDQVVILQQDRAVGADGQGFVVAWRRVADVVGGKAFRHLTISSLVLWTVFTKPHGRGPYSQTCTRTVAFESTRGRDACISPTLE